tara:strand:+ start:81 stop:608 length:528 start_codon:yes stop_codon:yes gene_type:complete
MPTTEKITQDELCLAFLERLRGQIPWVNRTNSWVDDEPIPYGRDEPPLGECISIVAGDSSFDPGLDNGSICSVSEDGTIIVTFMKRYSLDRGKELTEAIANSTSNMLRIKREVLNAILVDRNEGDQHDRWMPLSRDGNPMLTGFIKAVSYQNPRRMSEHMLYAHITFSTPFIWNL